mmetsp:Transcript_102609/g.260628  ORF Transcript_102609/g.260628 Transcript_102609/m.260628 type:complete len:282 (-) Transcript_102609:232-1077(-)
MHESYYSGKQAPRNEGSDSPSTHEPRPRHRAPKLTIHEHRDPSAAAAPLLSSHGVQSAAEHRTLALQRTCRGREHHGCSGNRSLVQSLSSLSSESVTSRASTPALLLASRATLNSCRKRSRESANETAKLPMRKRNTACQPNFSLIMPTKNCPTAAPTAPMPSMTPVQVDVARAPLRHGCLPMSTDTDEVKASAGPPCKTPEQKIIHEMTVVLDDKRRTDNGSKARRRKMLTTGLRIGTRAQRVVQSLISPALKPPMMKPQSNIVAIVAAADSSIPVPSLR